MKTYTWNNNGETQTGTLKEFARERLSSGERCTTPAGVVFDVKEVKRNNFVGIATDTTTGEIARSH